MALDYNYNYNNKSWRKVDFPKISGFREAGDIHLPACGGNPEILDFSDRYLTYENRICSEQIGHNAVSP